MRRLRLCVVDLGQMLRAAQTRQAAALDEAIAAFELEALQPEPRAEVIGEAATRALRIATKGSNYPKLGPMVSSSAEALAESLGAHGAPLRSALGTTRRPR